MVGELTQCLLAPLVLDRKQPRPVNGEIMHERRLGPDPSSSRPRSSASARDASFVTEMRGRSVGTRLEV